MTKNDEEMAPEIPDYTGHEEKVGSDAFSQLNKVADELLVAQDEVAKLEAKLKLAQAKVKDLEEHKLPELMAKVKQTECTTENGVKVTMVKKVHASWPSEEEKQAKAVADLERRNMGSIVKRFFTIKFGRDEEKWAKKFESDLRRRKQQVDLSVTRKVEPSTLTKFLKDTLEAGDPTAMDSGLYGGFVRKVAEVKRK